MVVPMASDAHGGRLQRMKLLENAQERRGLLQHVIGHMQGLAAQLRQFGVQEVHSMTALL